MEFQGRLPSSCHPTCIFAISLFLTAQTLTFYGLHGQDAWSQIGFGLSFFAAFFAIALVALYRTQL